MDNEKKLKYIAYFGGLSVNHWEDIPKNFAEDQENQFSGIQEICQKHKISCDELVILSDNAMFQDVRQALSEKMGCDAFIIGDDLAKSHPKAINEMLEYYAWKYSFIVIMFPYQKAMKEKVPLIRGSLSEIPKLHEYVIDWRGKIIGRERKR